MKLRLQLTGKQPERKRPASPEFPPKPRATTVPQVRRPISDPVRPRREMLDDLPGDGDTEAFLRADGPNRRIRRGLIPQTKSGRVAAGVVALTCLAAVCAGTVMAARFIATDPKFRIPSSKAIEIDGNSHLTRSQMLSVFGEDIERNIFSVPMEQRRAQMEQMPWVEHATVMRLLPDRIRVQVTERVPVAFVREGTRIGLVDANGVLLDIPPETGVAGYTFSVITGVKSSETAEQRAEQMKLYAAFVNDLDSDGKGTSSLLSEIDLSDPEDAKALIPDHNNEVLVHFGHENFLARYQRFQEHIAEWRSQYPRLSNVDMRYERQVVLQMPPKDTTLTNAASAEGTRAAHLQPASQIRPLASSGSPRPTALRATSSVPSNHVATEQATAAAKDAAQRKRIDAIKVWMAQRQKARATAQGTPAGTASGAPDSH